MLSIYGLYKYNMEVATMKVFTTDKIRNVVLLGHGGSGKTSEVVSLIDNYIRNGHKILVFSSFVQALKIIEINLFNSNISIYI